MNGLTSAGGATVVVVVVSGTAPVTVAVVEGGLGKLDKPAGGLAPRVGQETASGAGRHARAKVVFGKKAIAWLR